MPAGERRRGIPCVKWKLDIPETLAFRFEKLPGNHDPSTFEPIFGKKSQIISRLLEKYILDEEFKLFETRTL